MFLNPELESALVAYLQSRPWKEVNHLIVGIVKAGNEQALPKIENPAPQKAAKGKE